MVLALAAPAHGAINPSEALRTKVARQKSGPYAEVIRINADQGEAKNFFLKTKSITGNSEEANFRREPPGEMTFKVFTLNGKDVTADVTGVEGYDFKVPAQKAKFLRVRISPTTPTVQGCL